MYQWVAHHRARDFRNKLPPCSPGKLLGETFIHLRICIIIGNHSSVWGSFWHEGKWGFKCCYSFEKRSYCTGASGRDLFESSLSNAAAAFERKSDSNIEKENSDKDDKLEKKKHKKKKKKKDKKKHEEDDFETKVAKAMEKQRREEECADNTKDERKRAYNSLSGGHDKELSEAEIEAYKRRRVREDDPMAGFLWRALYRFSQSIPNELILQ